MVIFSLVICTDKQGVEILGKFGIIVFKNT